MLHELVYASKAQDFVNDEHVAKILLSARCKNEELSITGLLLFDGSNFLQIIEGDPTAVKEVFACIERDDRHFDIKLFHSGPIKKRYFDSWQMAFHREQSCIAGLDDRSWEQLGHDLKSVGSDQSMGIRILRLLHISLKM